MDGHSHFNREKIYIGASNRSQRRKINRAAASGMAEMTQRPENDCSATRNSYEKSHISPEI
jgi:hypothetical protein